MAGDTADKGLRTFLESNPPDVTMIAGIDDVKVQAHKKALSESSDYFYRMFETETEETQSSEVRLDIDGATLKLIVDFIYKAEIELNSANIENVLEAADYIEINALLNKCLNFMGKDVDASNCLGTLYSAKRRGKKRLFEKLFDLTCGQLKEVVTGQQFLELDMEQLDMLFTQIGCRHSLQEIFLNGLVAWCQHSEEERRAFLPRLLAKHIRFGWLDPKVIAEKGKTVSEILKSSELIDTWLKWHSSPESRAVEKKKLAIMFVPPRQEHFVVKFYDENPKTWSYEEWPNPHGRTEFSMIVIKNKLFIAGGFTGYKISNKVECLDLQTMKWSELHTIRNAPDIPALTEVDGILYAIACDGSPIETYDDTTKEWQYLEPLDSNNIDISETAVATCKGTIYATGPSSSDIYCYNPIDNKWQSIPSALEDETIKGHKFEQIFWSPDKNILNCDFCMTELNGDLYICRAQLSDSDSVTRTLQRYDPRNDKRKWIKTLNKRFKCFAHSDRLYVCCDLNGNKDKDFLCFVEEYNPNTDEWLSLPLTLFKDSVPICISDIHIFSA